ncbi:MAG TPA: host attachment protein [Gammaproteobacteria bacterium]
MSLLCVVAGQSRVRFFIQESAGKPLEEMPGLENPEGRLHKRDLTSDRPGRTFDSKGATRHAKEQKTDVKKQVAINFVRQITSYLEDRKNEYNELVLIAPPAFLGLLRENLHENLAKLVTREIDRDIVSSDVKDIQQYLKKF